MNPFVEQHQDETGCVLSCFDRVVITGTWPDLCHTGAMAGYLGACGICLFNYARSAQLLRDEIRASMNRAVNPVCPKSGMPSGASCFAIAWSLLVSRPW